MGKEEEKIPKTMYPPLEKEHTLIAILTFGIAEDHLQGVEVIAKEAADRQDTA